MTLARRAASAAASAAASVVAVVTDGRDRTIWAASVVAAAQRCAQSGKCGSTSCHARPRRGWLIREPEPVSSRGFRAVPRTAPSVHTVSMRGPKYASPRRRSRRRSAAVNVGDGQVIELDQVIEAEPELAVCHVLGPRQHGDGPAALVPPQIACQPVDERIADADGPDIILRSGDEPCRRFVFPAEVARSWRVPRR